jgi:hypothetical protein
MHRKSCRVAKRCTDIYLPTPNENVRSRKDICIQRNVLQSHVLSVSENEDARVQLYNQHFSPLLHAGFIVNRVSSWHDYVPIGFPKMATYFENMEGRNTFSCHHILRLNEVFKQIYWDLTQCNSRALREPEDAYWVVSCSLSPRCMECELEAPLYM